MAPKFPAFAQPAPVERVACRACGTYAADCECPVGEGSMPACWLCAHLITEHGVSVADAASSEACDCVPEAIYPPGIAECLRRGRVDAGIPAIGVRRSARERAHRVEATKDPESDRNAVDRVVRVGNNRPLRN